MTRKRIGEVLLEAGLITQKDLEEALNDQKVLGGRIGTILFEKNLINEHEFLLAVSSYLGIPAIDFSTITIEGKVLKLISKDVAWKEMVLPVKVLKTDSDEYLLLAMAEPRDSDAIHLVQNLTGLKVRPALALERDLRKVLQEYYETSYGQGDYRYSADDLRAPLRKEPRPPPAVMARPVQVIRPKAPVKSDAVKSDDELYLEKPRQEGAELGSNELEEKLIGEIINAKLATEALLRLLIQKGVVTAEEYREILRDLKIKQLGKAVPGRK